MNKRIICPGIILLILALLLVSCAGGPVRQQTGMPGRVVFITDLHFDPFGDPSILPELQAVEAEQWPAVFARASKDLGAYGRGGTPRLYLSLLERVKVVASDADFVIFLGDALAHGYNQTFYHITDSRDRAALNAFTLKTFQFIYLTLAQALPGKPIVIVLGNNDYYCDDYAIQPRGPFLKDLSGLAASHLNLDREENLAFDQSFPAGGYYSVTCPSAPGHRLIVLNATFFSSVYANRCGIGDDAEPGRAEMRWLESELRLARDRHEKVWLLSHIPPGLNVFSAIHGHKSGGGFEQADDFWREEFARGFQAILGRYADVIAATFSGHTHQDDFRASEKIGVFNKIIPAISPVFGNNPALTVASYSPVTMEAMDYQVHYLDLAANAAQPVGREQWALEYDFISAYGLGPLNVRSLAALHQALQDRPEVRHRWSGYYDVSNPAQDPMAALPAFRAYWCGQVWWTPAAFLGCCSTP